MPVKIILLLKRKAGLTPEQFRIHCENSHVIVCARSARDHLPPERNEL
jgi:hypothetical protein